ncbi:MAG: hypothetical protein ACREFZ_10885 [Acetobacteraceae bacterium]
MPIYRAQEANEAHRWPPRAPDTRATLAARARMLAEIITDRGAAENLRIYAAELEADIVDGDRLPARKTA